MSKKNAKTSPSFNPSFAPAPSKRKKRIDVNRLIKEKENIERKLLNETNERRRLSLEVHIENIKKKLKSHGEPKKSRNRKKHEDQKHGKVRTISVEEYLSATNNSVSQEGKIAEKASVRTSDKASIRELLYTPLTRQEVNHALLRYSTSQLLRLWDSRLELIPDQTSGAKVFSLLRFKQGIDKIQHDYKSYLNHQSVLDLPEDEMIPNEDRTEAANAYSIEYEQHIINSRKSGLVKQTIREGQSSFRTSLISHYGARCMITGDRVEEIIEAAHIIPYSGKESNHISNGLLLRVDLHRLFDKNLLGIDLRSMTVKLNERLEGTSYWALNSSPLKVTNPIFNQTFLRERWRQFKLSTSNS